MHPTSQFGAKAAALVAALLLVGTAGAQEARPAAPPAVPQIHKMIIYNGFVPTVSYSVEGGSPHLQALARTLQYTENEVNLTEELQKLRLGIVASEQTAVRVQTSQQLGFGPISTPGYAACYAPPDSSLRSALVPGLAQEATPAMAYELINLWEQLQTELQAEQARAAAPARPVPPAKQNAEPVRPPAAPPAPQPKAPPAGLGAAPQARVFAPAVPQQLAMLNPVANQQMVRQQIMQSLRQVFQRH